MTYSRRSVPVEVNCLKEALECGGKKLESWFWDQVTLETGGAGDGTGPPPAPLAVMF